MMPTINARPQRTRRLTLLLSSRGAAPATVGAGRSEGAAGASDMSGTMASGSVGPIRTKLPRNQPVILLVPFASRRKRPCAIEVLDSGPHDDAWASSGMVRGTTVTAIATGPADLRPGRP